jgi:signal transduction histidine kinase
LSSLRRALLALGAAGLVLAIPVAAVIATSDHTNLKGLVAVTTLLVGWTFLGTGLYLWDRRPANLTGPLMVALAFSWLLAELSASNAPGPYIVGMLASGLPFAILVHLLFAFPSGRLRTRWDRRWVALGYFTTIVLPPFGFIFFDPAVADDCPACPENPILIDGNQGVLDVLVAIQTTLAVAVLAAVIVDLVRRLRRPDDLADRVRDAPVWWAGGATLLIVLIVLATNVAPEEGNYDDYMFAAAVLVLATLPGAFWLGVLRSRLSEAGAVAEENVRLDAELQRRLDELRESRARIVEAGYAERKRVERDLHDGAQQRLVALALELQVVRARLETDPAAAAQLLEGAADELTGATQELRELARGLHPPVLTDRGLVPALEALASRATVPVSVEADAAGRAPEGVEAAPSERAADEEEAAASGRAPAAVEAAAYFVVSEALTNVARHARATRVVVRVVWLDGALRVEIEDDGTGGADLAAGSGLRGLADRVGALDGSLEVDSVRGRGTTIRASLPMMR